jgi:hypothetical protein
MSQLAVFLSVKLCVGMVKLAGLLPSFLTLSSTEVGPGGHSLLLGNLSFCFYSFAVPSIYLGPHQSFGPWLIISSGARLFCPIIYHLIIIIN